MASAAEMAANGGPALQQALAEAAQLQEQLDTAGRKLRRQEEAHSDVMRHCTSLQEQVHAVL